MTYTARQLINDAYYLSGIVGQSFEEVSGSQIEVGLNRLNAFLSIKGAQTELIPYYDIFEQQFVAGQEKYFIPNLVELDTLSFYLTNSNNDPVTAVRLPIDHLTRYQYLSTARPEGINAIPFSYYTNRVLGGMDLYVYFLPQIPYFYQVSGKFALQTTSLNQDLSLVYDGWYIEYLRYGLAILLCEWWQVVPAASLQKQADALEDFNMTLEPMDFTIRTRQYFRNKGGLNWADVNYGKGWRG